MKWVALACCAGWLAAVPGGARAAETTSDEAATEAPAEGGSLLSRVRPKGRLLLGIESDERDEWARRYGISQARLGFTLREEIYRVEVEADFADTSIVNDAWIELRASKPLRLKVGRFKEPFGAFRLESRWDVPLPFRPAIVRAVEDLGFGGRDLGAAVRYRLSIFEVEGGIFQGVGFGAEPPKESGALRVTVQPFDFVRLGTSLGRTAVFDGGTGDAIGADVQLAVAGFTGLVEWQHAEDLRRDLEESGTAGYLARRIAVGETTWLEPAVGADHLDGRGTGIAAALGAGLGDHFLTRLGVRHGPSRNEAAPDATSVELQMGVQL